MIIKVTTLIVSIILTLLIMYGMINTIATIHRDKKMRDKIKSRRFLELKDYKTLICSIFFLILYVAVEICNCLFVIRVMCS